MIITAELQALSRPLLDEVFPALGQRVQVRRAQVSGAEPGAQPPPEIDLDGNVITPLPVDPTPSGPGVGVLLGEYPAYFYAPEPAERTRMGGELTVPLWQGIVHHSAPLAVPGMVLTVIGGALPAPLQLTPLADATDLGTQGIAWSVVCRATDALSGGAG